MARKDEVQKSATTYDVWLERTAVAGLRVLCFENKIWPRRRCYPFGRLGVFSPSFPTVAPNGASVRFIMAEQHPTVLPFPHTVGTSAYVDANGRSDAAQNSTSSGRNFPRVMRGAATFRRHVTGFERQQQTRGGRSSFPWAFFLLGYHLPRRCPRHECSISAPPAALLSR